MSLKKSIFLYLHYFSKCFHSLILISLLIYFEVILLCFNIIYTFLENF